MGKMAWGGEKIRPSLKKDGRRIIATMHPARMPGVMPGRRAQKVNTAIMQAWITEMYSLSRHSFGQDFHPILIVAEFVDKVKLNFFNELWKGHSASLHFRLYCVFTLSIRTACILRQRTAINARSNGRKARGQRPRSAKLTATHKACITVNIGMGVYAAKVLLIMGLGRLGSLPGQSSEASGWPIDL